MGEGMHRLAQDVVERRGENLRGRAGAREDEAGAARPPEPEGVPCGQRLETVVLVSHEYLDLIARRRVGGAPARDEDMVRGFAVGNDGRLLHERESITGDVDGTDARPQVAADAELGRRRRDQVLTLHQLPEEPVEVRGPARVMDDAGHLDLVHREYHCRRPAVVTEQLADLRHVDDVEPEAPQFGREVAAEQLEFLQRVDALARETGVAIDVIGGRRDHVSPDLANLAQKWCDRGDWRHALTCSRSIATANASMLRNVLRLSSASGNSMSNASSIASIRPTVARDVNPA
jgi:hypothetical protein